jgi:hypothetical protein
MKKHFYKGFCWISISSLILSGLTFFIYVFRAFSFTNDAVIGVVATMIGVCATFMVGWQIFSSMQVRSELKDAQNLIKKLEGKLSKVNSTIDEQNGKIKKAQDISNELSNKLEQANSTIVGIQSLSDELGAQQVLIKSSMEEQSKELEDEKGRRKTQNELIFARMQQTKGYAFGYMQILSAYYYFIEALTIFLKHEATSDYKTVLNDLSVCILNMDAVIKNSNELILNNQEVDSGFIRKINYNNLTVKLLDDPKESPIEKLKMLSNYATVQEKIEKYEAERKRIVLEAKKIRETMKTSKSTTK